MSQQTSKPWSHKQQCYKAWRPIGVTCSLIISSGFYTGVSTAGFDTPKNASRSAIAAMVALSNVTGNGTVAGAKGGHAPINSVHKNGSHTSNPLLNLTGKNSPNKQKQNPQQLIKLDSSHPSNPRNSSSYRSKNSREPAPSKPHPRSRRQVAKPTAPIPLSSPQDFTALNCSQNYQQTATIRFPSEGATPFPACNSSNPFTGQYKSSSFGLENLHINKPGRASIFGDVSGADIQVNLFNVSIQGTGTSGAVASVAFGKASHISMSGEQISVEGSDSYEDVGGGAGFGGVGFALDQTECEINARSSGDFSHTGAGIGQPTGSITQTRINATVRTSGTSSDTAVGAGRALWRASLTQKGINGRVQSVGPFSDAGGGFGEVIGRGHTLRQTAVNLQVNATQGAYGSAFGLLGQDSDIKLWLYSGDAGGIPVCGAIRSNGQVNGFVDTAGYNAVATKCLGTAGDFRILNSTQREDWYTIHGTLCTPGKKRNGSCHSPHEQLLTLASGGGGTNGGAVYLVSEQRYPFRNSSDNQGLVHIVRLQREGNGSGNSTTLTLDQTFGVNGLVLLHAPTTPENRTLLRGLPVSQQTNGTHLTSLYALPSLSVNTSSTNSSSNSIAANSTAPTGVALVRFPLSVWNNRGVDIETYPDLPGRPFLLEQDDGTGERVWMWEQRPGPAPVNRLTRNQLTGGRFTEEQAFDLGMTAFPGHKIIAVNKDNHYVYVARRNDSDLQLERYELATGELDGWEGSGQLPSGTAGGQYALSISKQPVNGSYEQIRLDLHPLETASVPGSSEATGLRVLVPEYGGDAELTFFTPERIVADRFVMPAAGTGSSATPQSNTTPHSTTAPGNSAGAIAGGVAAATTFIGGEVACAIGCGCAYKHRNAIKKRWQHWRKSSQTWKPQRAAAQEDRFEILQETYDD